MASLRRIPRSPYWIANYRDTARRVCNRSTHVRVAGDGANERERGQDAARKRKQAQMVADLYEEAERGAPSEIQIRRAMDDIFKKITGRRMAPAIVETFFEAWLKRVATKRGEGATYDRYASVVRRFLEFLGARKTAQLSDVSVDELQAFVDEQIATGKASTTVSLEFKVLKGAFADAMKQGWCASNPAQAVALPESEGNSREAFTWQQVEALLGTATGDWKTAIALGAFTGGRLGDIVNLVWEGVDFAGKTIRFRPQKTKRKAIDVMSPMHPSLEKLLMELPLPDGNGANTKPVCPSLAGKTLGGRSGLSAQFRGLIDASGIENRLLRRGAGKGRSFYEFGFHSLRHTFNSQLINAGVAQEIRMRLSGHSSKEANAIYSHVELDTLRAAIGKLPGVET